MPAFRVPPSVETTREHDDDGPPGARAAHRGTERLEPSKLGAAASDVYSRAGRPHTKIDY
jgi:hypothetical protein